MVSGVTCMGCFTFGSQRQIPEGNSLTDFFQKNPSSRGGWIRNEAGKPSVFLLHFLSNRRGDPYKREQLHEKPLL